MCLVISFISLIFAYNAFMVENLISGFIALTIALFFITLMIKNILHVKKLREEKNDS